MRAIRVQFKPLGKRYYFSVGKVNVTDKTMVIVNTIRGIELGYCVGEIFDLPEEELTSELKDIVRIATAEDKKNYDKYKNMEPDVVEKTKYYAKLNNL